MLVDINDSATSSTGGTQIQMKVVPSHNGLLLSAKISQPSTSPRASSPVTIIEKNGVDIRLCIDYRRVSQLTHLVAYPMSSISELLDDLDKAY